MCLTASVLVCMTLLGSTDGYVNVFDCSQSDEDEAVMGTLNSESAVVSL